MAILIKSALPTVSAVREAESKRLNGKHSYFDITAPNAVITKVYNRMYMYHKDLWASRTDNETTQFGVFVAPGVPADSFRNLMQAHVFVAHHEDDYQRITGLPAKRLKVEVKALFSAPGENIEAIATFVRGVVTLRLITEVSDNYTNLNNLRTYRFPELNMGWVNGRYTEGVTAFRRLKFTEVCNFDLTADIAKVEALLAEMDSLRAPLREISERAAAQETEAKALTRQAEVIKDEAIKSENSKQLLTAMTTIDEMILQMKELRRKAKEIVDTSDPLVEELQAKLAAIYPLVPVQD